MSEKVTFKNKRGQELVGILARPEHSTEKCVILCHGITVDKTNEGGFNEMEKRLVSEGFTSFRFDYAGSGESEGDSLDMTSVTEQEDFASAVNYVKELGFESIGVVANSFSGNPVLLHLRHHPSDVDALVLWFALIDNHSIFNPVSDLMKEKMGPKQMEEVSRTGQLNLFNNNFFVSKNFFNVLDEVEPWKGLESFKNAVLFIHGDKDDYVPYEDSVKYSKMFNHHLETIEGGDHGFHGNRAHQEQAMNAAINFFKQHL